MAEPPKRFARVHHQAREVVKSPSRMRRLVEQTTAKLDGVTGGKLAEMRQQVELALSLLRDYVRGDYRDVAGSTLISVVAALMYFVMPFDAIPDFLFGWGFVDDVAVLGYVFTQIREELERYKAWMAANEVRPMNGNVESDGEQASQHGESDESTKE